ncbi:hypothetical protein [Schaalia vaccimaxillae]|uniref:hypothetical protein n=1 Tax=Schaalia vaccimaxillae TaxID=183916 RepID=UPI0003B771CC|nr:hypothetical protein [Schaalia vaccimaxillae]
MDEPRIPRRPAMLDPARAEAIVGDEDPAAGSAVAHTAAWALLGVGDEELGTDAVERLRRVVRSEGVDVIAHVWSRSPEFTLPGALWRLYLLEEWYQRDRLAVETRYEEGLGAQIVPGLEQPVRARNLESVMDEVSSMLRGDLTDDDLDWVLAAAAKVLRIVAAGETHGASWIVDPSDPLAYPVTTRAKALLRTAEELDAASREAQVGALE